MGEWLPDWKAVKRDPTTAVLAWVLLLGVFGTLAAVIVYAIVTD